MHIVSIAGAPAEEFSERGAQGVKRKTFVDQTTGTRRFVLRYYALEPGGQTPYDIHPYEHIVIITKGAGTVLTLAQGAPSMRRIQEGDVIYIGEKEPHQFLNTGSSSLEFHCFRGMAELYAPAVDQALRSSAGSAP
jgi:quercetin dioxygenase-like cupin family protein